MPEPPNHLPATDARRTVAQASLVVISPGDGFDGLAGRLGPCYTTRGLRTALGISRQAVWRATKEHRVLRLQTPDGVSLYPAAQVRDGKLIPGIRPVLDVLAEGGPYPFMWASWLLGPTCDGRCRYIDQLAAGDVDGVVLAARHTATAWSS